MACSANTCRVLPRQVHASAAHCGASRHPTFSVALFQPPLPRSSRARLQVSRGKYTPVPAHYGPDVGRVIAALLTPDPNTRPTVDDLLGMPEVRGGEGRKKRRSLAHSLYRLRSFALTCSHLRPLSGHGRVFWALHNKS